MALKRKLNYFLVTDGASGISNNGNPAVRNAREAQIKWELEHGADPYEDWGRPETAAIVSRDVVNGAKPRKVVRDRDGTLQVIGPRGNDPSDAMLVSEDEARRFLKNAESKPMSPEELKELRDASGQRQVLHRVDSFPEPGIAMKDFYDAMLSAPVKKV